jgi:Flp pilus assembly protein TadG
MFKLWNDVKLWIARFRDDKAGMLAPVAALALIPVMAAVGAAVDYSRANNIRSKMQTALDTGLLAGAKGGSSNWKDLAGKSFDANFSSSVVSGLTVAKDFVQETGQKYKGSASAVVPTVFLGMLKISTLTIAVKATATASEPDNSCILTLDKGQPASHVALTLNGAPIVNLSGCSIRSNTSLDCNGHDGNITKAIAAGSASGCGSPQPGSLTVPDIYEPLASNITTQCGTTRGSLDWPAGTTPVNALLKTVTVNGRTEYHVCGDLNLSGNGLLTGTVPVNDALIVIENGSLNIANNADVKIAKMAVVLTGNNQYSSTINFPTGNGKQGALTLSPPIEAGNPWQGVALYLDPKLTKDINNKWGPGASFSADGLVYLGNSNVVTDGNTQSSNAKCSKFVMNQFTTNGHVNLDFDQTVETCAAIGLKQWGGIIVHLLQ